MLSFDSRKDLSLCEKMAIMSYRDIGYPQHVWEIDGYKRNRPNHDCDMINGYLRGKIPKSKFTKLKLKYLNYLIATIAHAIDKSRVDRKLFTVYKGVSYFPELDKYCIGHEITDKAFSSFTTSKKKALEYAGVNADGEKIIFVLTLKKGDKAIYVDDTEQEWLVQKENTFIVKDIAHSTNTEWGRAILYYLRFI